MPGAVKAELQRSQNSPVLVFVEHIEDFLDLVLVAGPVGHHGHELLKVDGAAPVLVHLGHHRRQLLVRHPLADPVEDGAKLLQTDETVRLLKLA